MPAQAWAGLPKRPVPLPGELGGQDNTPGWIANVMVQGLTANGYDHVAVEALPADGVRLSMWNDDPVDWPGQRVAHIWTILPLAPDPTFGSGDRERLLNSVRNEQGISEDRRAEVLAHLNDPANYPLNTRQSQVIYADNVARYAGQDVRPWSEFVPPPEAVTRHGVMLTNEKWAEHLVASHTYQDHDPLAWGWRHWCDHLPANETEIDARGRRELKGQREQGRYAKATRTITYYQRDTDLAQGWAAATHEDELQTTTATTATETATSNAAFLLGWAFASPSGAPNSAAWDGVYHIQLDCTAASGGLVYMPNTATTDRMAIERLASDLATNLESDIEDITGFSGAGLKLATSGSEVFTSPATSDRFGFGVLLFGDSHGDAITLRLNGADSYADGPWSAGTIEQKNWIRWQNVPNMRSMNKPGTFAGRSW